MLVFRDIIIYLLFWLDYASLQVLERDTNEKQRNQQSEERCGGEKKPSNLRQIWHAALGMESGGGADVEDGSDGDS